MNNRQAKQHSAADLTYDSFKEQLCVDFRKLFADGTQISISSFSHNNRNFLDGLTILEAGSNISPTIYLEEYYTRYVEGAALPDIEQQIYDYYQQHRARQNIDTSFFTCLDRVRPRIACKLVNYDKNRELLKEIPHFAYLDLAIVFYYLIPDDSRGNASILIYNSHLAYWNISKDALLLFAQTNTPSLLPWRCNSMAHLLFPTLDALPESEKQETLELLKHEAIPMHVLTNCRCFLGACCILYPDVLKTISDGFGDNLILLPGSIHEFILVPSAFTEDPEELRKIVREVNLTAVAPEEILSDSIYLYDRSTDKVTML